MAEHVMAGTENGSEGISCEFSLIPTQPASVSDGEDFCAACASAVRLDWGAEPGGYGAICNRRVSSGAAASDGQYEI